MKTVIVLSILCVAFAEITVKPLKEGVVAVPDANEATDVSEMDEKMVQTEGVDAAPASRNAQFSICPNDWSKLGCRCFKFIRISMNWFSAEEHCKVLGGNLASVTSPREYALLQQLTQTSGQTTAWLGGFHLQGRWMWIDNEGFYYTNWYQQAPAASNPCVFLRSNNGWGNLPCIRPAHFICSTNPF